MTHSSLVVGDRTGLTTGCDWGVAHLGLLVAFRMGLPTGSLLVLSLSVLVLVVQLVLSTTLSVFLQ